MAASMKDVANKAWVSAATAARIHQAIEELGFVRNGTAVNLRAGKSRSIGLVVPDIGNPFFTDIARGAEDMAGARQYAMVLCSTDEDQEKQERYLRLLIQQGVDGLLIRPNDEDEEPLLALRERGLSVVLINRQTENRNFCSVVVDGERGSEESVDYLAGLGHKHIAWATWSLKNPGFATRAKGIAKAAKRWGMDVSTITVQGMNNGSGEIAAEKFLTLEPRPTAILCANDLLALDALRGLIQRGIRVPEDVSVIGFDDIDFCANARVPLTTVAVPRYQIGSTAAGLLLDEIDNPEKHAHQQVVFQPRLIIRESSGPAPLITRPI
jgi:LacI family transcriptional regulator